MVKNVYVKKYKRRKNRKIYIVKAYRRKHRKVGTKVKQYTAVGTLMIGHDKYGNIIGNKVVVKRKRRKIIKKAAHKKRIGTNPNPRIDPQDRINDLYKQGKISFEEWYSKRKAQILNS
jgi:hypothetical protein